MTLILNGTDNSVSAPAVQGGTAGTTTGEYFPATNQWAVATNGTQAMLVDASQNVGIGTSSPGAKLDVTNGGIQITTAGYNLSILGGPSGTLGGVLMRSVPRITIENGTYENTYIGCGASVGNIIFQQGNSTTPSSNTERMRIDSSGNVGIGTTTPTSGYKLNVGSTSSVTTLNGAAITLFTSGGLTSNVGGVLNFRPQLGTTISDIFNLSICAYDHSGDGNADGLSINGADGVSFSTGGNTRSEKMRIDSSGNVVVMNALTGGTGAIFVGRQTTIANAKIEATGNDNILVTNQTDTGTAGKNILYILRNTNYVGGITCTNTTTSFPTSSDYRLKQDIAPMTGALDKVAALKPVTYKWKLDGSDGEGFIAHELAEVCPHAVTGEKDAVDEDGNPKYQGIDVSFLVATLTAAIQELKAEFDAYKATHP